MAQKAHADGGTDDEPNENYRTERLAIRGTLGPRTHVLTYHGSEPYVVLARRDRAPPTEHTTDGEALAMVEWADEKVGYPDSGWALSTTHADATGWELPREHTETFDSREAAVQAATEWLKDQR
jgi:hypothetical protein